MNVLLANEITASMVLSTNAPERRAGEVEWANTAWPAGSVVTRTTTQRVYRAAFAVPAGGVPPEENIAAAQLPYWVDIGPMNRAAMFDKVLSSQTVGPSGGDLVVEILPGATTDLWLSNLSNANAVQVQVWDRIGGSLVYEEHRTLREKVTTYWDWWFAPFRLARDASFTGIPAYRDCVVKITLETGSTAAIGMAAPGIVENLGCTEWDVNASFQRYAPSQPRQAWGPEQLGGVITKDVTYRVFVRPQDAPRVDRFTKLAMNRLGVYLPSGQPQFEGIRIFGELISAEMGYPFPGHVPFDITVREFL